jgi:hypothetical protein
MTDTPPLVCDKLVSGILTAFLTMQFVPPNMSDAINRAVHAVSLARRLKY